MAEQILQGGGEIIPDWEFLESLAGVGHKTASVVMAQAFGVPAFPVDTHIHRLASRWGLSKARNVEQTERDLKAVFPIDAWNRRHLQIIFFGREYCPARNHNLSDCPICGWAASKKRIRRIKAIENQYLTKIKTPVLDSANPPSSNEYCNEEEGPLNLFHPDTVPRPSR